MATYGMPAPAALLAQLSVLVAGTCAVRSRTCTWGYSALFLGAMLNMAACQWVPIANNTRTCTTHRSATCTGLQSGAQSGSLAQARLHGNIVYQEVDSTDRFTILLDITPLRAAVTGHQHHVDSSGCHTCSCRVSACNTHLRTAEPSAKQLQA